jgi:hypothetical protein
MTLALWILAAIALLHTADVVTTTIGLRRGDIEEANPFARKLFGALGVLPAAIALKLVLSVPMARCASSIRAGGRLPAIYAASLVVLFIHNLRELRRKPDGG